MEEAVEYAALYAVQDAVLNDVFSLDTGFYLSGGTCLHRFYLQKRYSDDLDFFCNDNDLFREYLRDVLEKLENSAEAFEQLVNTRDFARIKINMALKVDFVNDRVFRLGRSVQTARGYRIDNIDNILANKISAIIGRDEPKDVFDICAIASSETIHWDSILGAALKKCFFEKDFLLDRLSSFPLDLLDTLAVYDRADIDKTKKYLETVIEAIAACCAG